MKFDLRRKRTLAGLGVTLAMTLPLTALAGVPAQQDAATRSANEYTDHIIVKYRNAAAATTMDASTMSMAATTAARRSLGLQHVRRLAQGAEVFRLNNRINREEADTLAREIQANDPNVEYAEADSRLYALLTPNDPQYATQQWDYFEAAAGINAPAAWDKATGAGVVVAVIDTGYRPHADLVANILPGYDFISDASTARDGNGRDANAEDNGDTCDGDPSSWHGTHVAGTIAAVTNNGVGVAGVAFNAKVQPVRVLGSCGGTISDIADAIVWASGGTVSGVPANPTPARVINMSLGGSGACSATLQSAINGARSRGTVVVVAAGNSNTNASSANPANCAGVVSVAAVVRSGGRASYSNFGAVVDLAAPGGDSANPIVSTMNAGTSTPGADSYKGYSGTSMAAPHVAGVAALMLSVNAALTPDEVEARLKSSTRPFPAPCNQCGTGLLDANAAVDAALNNAPPPPPPSPPPPPPPPPPASTTVPETTASNDTRATAQVIASLPVTVDGSVSSSDLNDYYAVTLAPGKTLTATLTPPSSADFDLYLYNASGSQISNSLAGTGAVDTARATNSGTTSVTVYVRALRYSGSGAYKLALTQ